ncbi:MAG: hypothetical protein NVS9B15_26020 [Acidobacteriaceae bacterium]
MSTVSTDPETVARRLIDGFITDGDDHAVDEVLARDAVVHTLFHTPVYPAGLSENTPAPERMKAIIGMQRKAIDGMRATIEKVIVAGDHVTVIGMTSGQRDGKDLNFHVINIYRVQNGKIVEVWLMSDRLGMYQQMGVAPASQDLLQKAGMR